MFWNIYAPHGTVSDISSWPDYDQWEHYLPISLFVGTAGESYPQALDGLNNWMDFIWSDDAFPWVTERGANQLAESGLTGLSFEATLLTDIDCLELETSAKHGMSRVKRAVFTQSTTDHPDFFVDEQGLLALSDEAFKWLQRHNWKNYDAEAAKPC